MDSMFCYQCEQTAKGTGCTVMGVCGKNSGVAHEQDALTCEMISLARVCKASDLTEKEIQEAVDFIVDGLFTTITNVNFNEDNLRKMTDKVGQMRSRLGGEGIKEISFFLGSRLTSESQAVPEDLVCSIASTLLFGLRGMGAYAHHARILGKRDKKVDEWFITGMAALAEERSKDDWVSLLMEFGQVNLRCMELLEEANTGAYGNPIPYKVPLAVEKGPFIVISGHDLRDLEMLLIQTEGKGVNIYTHGEMLPAHGYPNLKKYSHLKGNFGTAWQNQQKEFDKIPAPVLFTTNCLMTPKESYRDRVYTTSVVSYPDLKHICDDEQGRKDFTEIIEHAIKLGGYEEEQKFTGINGGAFVTTGFGKNTILENAPAIIDAVKNGAIKHFFLVGGCDGAKPGRNYYTDFVKKLPEDTVVLTVACGKFRFNDYDAGNIGPFPRILDMGQCNDAYGAIQVAVALSKAFECEVNELPLTLVLSWYEQKAVCILLTLLSLGIKNIYIGPSIPAFFSEDLIKVLVDTFKLHPISTPEEDIKKILNR